MRKEAVRDLVPVKSETLRNLRFSFRSKVIILIPCAFLLGWSVVAALEHAVDAPEIPSHMSECEGRDNATCGTWTFDGTEGTGQWRGGAFANLTVQQFEPGWVIIRRSDPSGASPGLTAIYVGKIQGQRVEGTVTWRWLGHWTQEAKGTWFATFGEPGPNDPTSSPRGTAPQPDPGGSGNATQNATQNTGQDTGQSAGGTAPPGLPKVMHWCSQHCVTLIWENGHYTNAASPGKTAWTVDSFTQGSVLMHRTDYEPYPGKAVLTGRISSQGNAILNGTIAWTYHPCCGLSSGTFNAAWGAALGTVPGSDAERDRGHRAPDPDHTAQALTPNTELSGQTEICISRRIKGVMQSLELAMIHDPNGALLSLFVGALTGVNAQSHAAQIVGSGNGTDNGQYTSKDPGSFVCRGFFIHKEVQIEKLPDADGLSGITAEYMKELMSHNPVYIEWFKVKPLGNGHYGLSLLPSSIPLSREYAKEFTYPSP
jgi:hypothetical protein